MKLVTKFIFIYLLVTLFVLTVGGIISYYIIKDEIDTELRYRFMDRINRVTYLIDHGRDFGFDSADTLERNGGGRNMLIREVKGPVKERVMISDTTAWNPYLRRMENNVKVAAYRKAGGRYYYISTYGVLIESDDITVAVVKTLLWIFGMQVIGAVGVGFVISGNIFKPFRDTLHKIRNFKLNHHQPIEAKKTNVKEFDELNRFVEEMTTKAISDYQNLKEFAENASHELQTPLSIAQGKLELLTETELNPEQFQYVESAQNAIHKLSKLSESLGLLTKIENHEFSNSQLVDFTDLVKKSLVAFDELITLNGLTVHSYLEEGVTVQIHPVLADILWTNLLQNAIRHNVKNGSIDIHLTKEHLVISNPGKPLNIEPGLLFERFKKADQSTSSIGLGLSIVKRIVNQSDFQISYDYSDSQHKITVAFFDVSPNLQPQSSKDSPS